MIIVEGPDGAGKTTLVVKLCREFSELRVGERGTKDRDFLWRFTVHDTMKALSRFALSQGPVCIWDRLFYSELVYAPLGMPPRPVEFNPSQQTHIMRLIHAGDFPVILCMPQLGTILKNIASETHQMPGVREKAAEIYHSYGRLLVVDDLFPERTMVYDYTGESNFTQQVDIDGLMGTIQDYIDDKRERSW